MHGVHWEEQGNEVSGVCRREFIPWGGGVEGSAGEWLRERQPGLRVGCLRGLVRRLGWGVGLARGRRGVGGRWGAVLGGE